MIKLLADENVHYDIVADLRKSGFDITTAIDAGLAGCKDRQILEYSEKEGRILLTGDKDFGGLLEFGLLYGKGKVILLRYTIMDIKRITYELVELLKNEEKTFESARTLLVVLSEGRYRIHRP